MNNQLNTPKTKKETNQEVKEMTKEVKQPESKEVAIKENEIAKKRQAELRESLRRGTFENAGRLTVDKTKEDKDYVYRFVNDQPGKIDRAISLGYEFVVDDNTSTGFEIDNPNGLGSKKVIEVGKYKGSVKSYYMRCPKDIYEARKKADREADAKRFESAKRENQRDDQRDK